METRKEGIGSPAWDLGIGGESRRVSREVGTLSGVLVWLVGVCTW